MNELKIVGPLTNDDVADVRRFVEKVHQRHVQSIDDVSRVSMTAHELLDNAIKFSVDGSATLNIAIESNNVHITTRNRARSTDVDGLKKIADGLKASPDPMVYYLELMGRGDVRGGLGLGRVAAEGEMDLELTLDGDVVEVHARSILVKPQ